MNKIRTYPNVIWITLVILASAVVVWVTGMMIYASISDFLDGDGLDLDTGGLLTLIFFVLAFLFMIFSMWEGVSYYACYVVFDDEGVRIVRPLRLYKVHYTWSALKGYSQSEYIIGKRGGSDSDYDSFYSSSSIIIYTLDDKAYEIVKLYNWKFDEVQPELKKSGIKYLGYEAFRRGWLFRQYRFLEKGVRSNYED